MQGKRCHYTAGRGLRGDAAPRPVGAFSLDRLVRALFALYGSKTFVAFVPPAGELSESGRATRYPTDVLRDGLWCTSYAQVAILDRGNVHLPIRDRRMTFWERPTPALADRGKPG
jgi:hypothetical protein